MKFYFMISSVYFSPVMFIFRELFKDRTVRVGYRTQCMHSNIKKILFTLYSGFRVHERDKVFFSFEK